MFCSGEKYEKCLNKHTPTCCTPGCLCISFCLIYIAASCSLRCPCCSGADEHGWGYISHTATAGPCCPPHIHLQPAFLSLLTHRLIQRAVQRDRCVPSAPQRLLQRHSWTSAPLLQQGKCPYKGSLQLSGSTTEQLEQQSGSGFFFL